MAPLFVSLLTTAVSYTFAAAFLLGFAIVSLCFEFICTLQLPLFQLLHVLTLEPETGIEIVYRRLPILADSPRSKPESQSDEQPTPSSPNRTPRSSLSRLNLFLERFKLRIANEAKDWVIFIRAPVFFSCLSISLLYLTVLS